MTTMDENSGDSKFSVIVIFAEETLILIEKFFDKFLDLRGWVGDGFFGLVKEIVRRIS